GTAVPMQSMCSGCVHHSRQIDQQAVDRASSPGLGRRGQRVDACPPPPDNFTPGRGPVRWWRRSRAVVPRARGTPVCGRDRSSYAESGATRSEEHTSELQSRENLVCRLLLEKKKESNESPHSA